MFRFGIALTVALLSAGTSSRLAGQSGCAEHSCAASGSARTAPVARAFALSTDPDTRSGAASAPSARAVLAASSGSAALAASEGDGRDMDALLEDVRGRS